MKKMLLLFASLLWGALTALAFDQYERMAVGETKTFYFPSEVTSRSSAIYNYNCSSDHINNVEVVSYTKTSVTVRALKYLDFPVQIRFDYWWRENGFTRGDTHTVYITLSDESGPDLNPDLDPENYSIDRGSWGTISVKVGSTKTVYCNFDIPYSEQLKSIVWSNTGCLGFDIVKQDYSSCTIKGTSDVYKEGQKLWCLMKYGNATYRAYYIVKTQAADVPKNISLPSSLSVQVGSTVTLSPTITPSTAVTTLTWSSSDTSVATVSSSGVVKGVKEGTTMIAVTTANDITATCMVTVKPILPESISITSSKTIGVDETFQLTPSITPANAKKDVTWVSSDEGITTVSSSGLVKGIAEGTALITAYTVNGLSSSCSVTVKPNPVRIELQQETDVLIGSTITLTPIITPSNALYTLTWSSQNTKVATVTSDGVVRGIRKGTTTITVKTNNGLESACKVVVHNEFVDEMNLIDGQDFTNVRDLDCDRLTYSRTFKNTNWQAWYVPFDLILTDEVLQKFSFAKFAGTYTEEDGSFYITVVRLREGELVQANTAYCVQAKVANRETPQEIALYDAVLQKAVENSFYVLSAEKKITFWGNYSSRIVTEDDTNWYALSGGQYSRQLPGNTIAPFRCFFTIADRADNPYATENIPATVRLVVMDDDATNIEWAEGRDGEDEAADAAVYDLSGRRLVRSGLSQGVYIVKGRKVFVK